jgi:hypothetical protein
MNKDAYNAARHIRDLALDLEKTGRLISLMRTENQGDKQERTDMVARNRNIQCAIDDALALLVEMVSDSENRAGNFDQWFESEYPDVEDRQEKYRMSSGYQLALAGWSAATERAAKICESVNNHDNPMTAIDCADEIRGNK